MNDNTQMIEIDGLKLIQRASDIVSAYVASNRVPVGDLPALIAATHSTLAALGRPVAPTGPEIEKPTPAQIRKSVTPEALISFEDGKSYKTLRRHLTLRDLSPMAYREKWGLPIDYPMTAAAYSAQRSELARSLGLGQQRRKFAALEPEAPAEKPKRAGRSRRVKEPVAA